MPLVGLVVVVLTALIRHPGMDPVTAQNPVLRHVHDHPIRSAMEHHRGRWRDAWLMVAPWGVTLAALLDPSPALIVALIIAYAQLLVATNDSAHALTVLTAARKAHPNAIEVGIFESELLIESAGS